MRFLRKLKNIIRSSSKTVIIIVGSSDLIESKKTGKAYINKKDTINKRTNSTNIK